MADENQQPLIQEVVTLVEGKLEKTILKQGEANVHPEKGDEVEVHYIGTLADGKKFDSSRDRDQTFRFRLGQNQVIKGWDVGVASMCKGELCKLKIHPDFGYGKAGSPPVIPADAELNFEIELLSFSKPKKEKFAMSCEEKIQTAADLKQEGNEAYKQGKIKDALSKYMEGVSYFDDFADWSDEPKKTALPTFLSLRLNLANACLKTESWLEVITHCTEVLNYDKNNVKALFRRGRARRELHDFDLAKDDLLAAAKLEPKDVEIRKEFKTCLTKLQEAREKEKKAFGGMFK